MVIFVEFLILMLFVLQAFEDYYVLVHPSLSEYALTRGPVSPSSPLQFHSSHNLRSRIVHASPRRFFSAPYAPVSFKSTVCFMVNLGSWFMDCIRLILSKHLIICVQKFFDPPHVLSLYSWTICGGRKPWMIQSFQYRYRYVIYRYCPRIAPKCTVNRWYALQ
jgi:hypothetical protein